MKRDIISSTRADSSFYNGSMIRLVNMIKLETEAVHQPAPGKPNSEPLKVVHKLSCLGSIPSRAVLFVDMVTAKN